MNTKREKSMLLRFTAEELSALTQKAKRTHCSREEFCRRVLNGATVKEAPSLEVAQVIMELRRIGCNINQIAQRCNGTGIVDTAELRQSLTELRTAAKSIVDAYSEEGVKNF